jgi:6-phosphogluconolactonase
MMQPLRKVTVFPDALRLAAAGTAEFYTRSLRARAGNGIFTCGLSGGTTPRTLFSQIAGQSESRGLPAGFWNSIHFFWGDEREVPPDHPDSNFRLAREELFRKVAIPAENLHRIRPEIGGASAAADEYERELKRFFDVGMEAMPRFDLIFLGLGEDGHTASLFPGSAALEESRRWVTVARVERLGASRITMTLPVLNHAACVIFLVSGKSKAPILRRVLCENPNAARLPAATIQPVEGELLWFVDQAAASDLPADLIPDFPQ